MAELDDLITELDKYLNSLKELENPPTERTKQDVISDIKEYLFCTAEQGVNISTEYLEQTIKFINRL